LIRYTGNDENLQNAAVENLRNVGAGHSFLILMQNAFPINVLSALKNCFEVVNLFCATANPVQALVAQTDQGRGIIGVVDGESPAGVENAEDQKKRHEFLRMIGYKQ